MKSNALTLLQPAMIGKAVKTFDRTSGVMVIAVWAAALAFMGLAYFAVEQTVAARSAIATAQATEPVLPEIRQDDVPRGQVDGYIERVTKRYGSKVSVSNAAGELKISATTADAFSSWMGAISYLDTIAPDMTWTIKDFCVGPECKEGLMSVRLTAKKISFVAPTESDSGN